MADRLAFYCDPALHGGDKVGADYYVLPTSDADDGHRTTDPSFAACADHLLHAVRHVMAGIDGRTVEVRHVTGITS